MRRGSPSLGLVWCTVTLGLAAPSCGPGRPPRHVGYMTSLCQARCEFIARCKPKGSDSCVERCKREISPTHVYDSEIFVRELERCTRNRLCGIPSECDREARASFEGTDATKAFCARRVAKDHACGIDSRLEDCVEDDKVFVDGVFPLLSDCLGQDCEQYQRCLLGVFVNPPR